MLAVLIYSDLLFGSKLIMNKSSLSFAALSSVIAEGDLATLRSHLENGNSSPNECDEYGQTLLMVAAQHGQTHIVNELIAQGADVNAEDSDSWSALMNAAKAGYKDVVIKLLDHGALIEKRDMGNWTPLMWACYKGHYHVVQVLIENGASVNVYDKFHCSCLIWAAGRGHHDIVKVLLEYGAKVNSGDKHGSSPLVWACRKGYVEVVELLLDAGANADTAGMFSWTPLIVAASGNYVAIINMLLEHRPNVNAVDMEGCTALTIACKEGYTEIAVALMNAGAYINLQDRNGDTNLIHAAKAGHFSIVDALLKKYADVDLHGSEGKTPLYWAVEKGYADIVRLILNANPNIESPIKDGDSALLKATRTRHAEIVQMLVDKKCRVSVTDKKGDTALHIAMRARSKAIVEILLRNPKNSQLLYRPNRAGETPYNIDTSYQKSILAQIFGARRLNTNEDSENRLGYDLYSSALADILSEPSLSMPITVGLYAKWGSGKSFLLKKLENEMRNFAIQWLEPVFELSWLVFLIVVVIALVCGITFAFASHMWIVGVAAAAGICVFSFIFLGMVVYSSKKYSWAKMNKVSVILATQLSALRTLLFVIFCNPPCKRRSNMTEPVRFLFTEQTKVTSSGNDNSIVQILISLYMAIEKEYGFFTCRLYRVLRPKPVQAQHWQWRRLCCIPNFLIALFVFGCVLGGLALLFIASAADTNVHTEEPSVVRSILIALACFVALILVSNLYTWVQVVGSLIISHQRRIARSLTHLESTQTMNYITSLKTEVDTIVQMVQCLDAFVSQQTRLVVIVDGLDSCEQEKVLHVLDAVHLLFSDASAPFLTVLAIDPHIVILAIESNINRAFHNSSISGHEYLRNVVHLPFYLQNSGLRRVKAAQQAALHATKKMAYYWNEDRELDRGAPSIPTNRKASNASMSNPDNYHKRSTKGNQKLKASESMASSISNLHRVVFGAQDLTKILLTDDYFSDVNPRSMRRLMNIVYVTGRLLKAFNIDFNWYHLASWVNITEQWPYRTSWIIMYYEMHESEMDESTSLKSIYEKIRCCMPTSKDDDSMLDLDHDERKFEVFLSVHSGNLLTNDMKVFLPFTINLDPYIRKIIQEEHQMASEILKTDLKPSNSKLEPSRETTKWLSVQAEHQFQQKSLFSSPKTPQTFMGWMPSAPPLVGDNSKRNYQCNMASPISHHMVQSPNPMLPWWSGTAEPMMSYSMIPFQNKPDITSYLEEIKTEEKLSSLSVEGVTSLLPTLQKLDKQKISSYSNVLKEHNINGQVLLTCNLDELKKVMNMSFGDWELFRVLILTLREQEATGTPEKQIQNTSPTRSTVHIPGLPHNTQHLTSLSVTDSPDFKRKETAPAGSSRNRSDSIDSRSFTRARSNSSILEKQVTMEESMIVGALETLNEEAIEDALEEQRVLHAADSTAATMSSGAPSNPLSPILSDPEEHNLDSKMNSTMGLNPACAMNGPHDIDVMYIRTARDSPMLCVSALSLTDSITDLETSSITQSQHFQPVIECRSSPASLARTASNEYSDSISATSSPSRTSLPDKPVIRVPTQRPSSLIHDNSVTSSKKLPAESDSNILKSKPPQAARKIPEKLSQEKNRVIRRPSKGKNTKKIKIEEKRKESSSDSSTETENVITYKKASPTSPKVTSPPSEADPFFSDDEHTPLVSPFHNKSSHYNLQAAQKHEKDGACEKVMPKHAISDPSSCLKLRKPLERQFSIDSYLCEKVKLARSSPTMVEIPDSSSQSSAYGIRNLPVYGQNVVDTPSPENKLIGPLSDPTNGSHTETVL